MQNDLRAGEREVDAQSATRLRVTPNRLPSEHIDGVWWPRSTQLAAELPALLSSLSDRLGQVVGVGYRRDGWTDTPPHIDIADQPVQLMGFTSDEPASVIVIGHDGHHLTLRVIAPATTEQAAREALAAIPERGNDGATGPRGTAAARSVADVADRLARHEGAATTSAAPRSCAGARRPLNSLNRHESKASSRFSSNTSSITGCTKPAHPPRHRQTNPAIRRQAAKWPGAKARNAVTVATTSNPDLVLGCGSSRAIHRRAAQRN